MVCIEPILHFYHKVSFMACFANATDITRFGLASGLGCSFFTPLRFLRLILCDVLFLESSNLCHSIPFLSSLTPLLFYGPLITEQVQVHPRICTKSACFYFYLALACTCIL